MNTLPPRTADEDLSGESLMHSDPQYAPLLEIGSHLPHVRADGSRGVEGLPIQPVLIPSNRASARGGLTETEGGPAYVYERLERELKRGKALVENAIVIECTKVLEDLHAALQQTNIRNSREICVLMQHVITLVCGICEDGTIPLILGGSHDAALALAGVLKANPDPADPRYSDVRAILFDGDADYLDEPDVGNFFAFELWKDADEPIIGNAQGRTFSKLQGFGPKALQPIMQDVPLLKPPNTLFIGAQRADGPEVKAIRKRHCQYLTSDAIRKYPAAAESYLRAFVRGKKFHVSNDLDLIAKSELVRNYDDDTPAGAPMATIEGMSIDTYLWLCRVLGSAGTPVSIEGSEVAPLADQAQGGITRAVMVGGIMRQLGAGLLEYHLDYDPFGE
jgi:arginase family enzyme